MTSHIVGTHVEKVGGSNIEYRLASAHAFTVHPEGCPCVGDEYRGCKLRIGIKGEPVLNNMFIFLIPSAASAPYDHAAVRYTLMVAVVS